MVDCKRPVIIIAEDDPDDQFMIREAIADIQIKNPIRFVSNGMELMDFLKGNLDDKCEKPGLILLDLNMPYKNGKEALKEIKADERYDLIPVVVLTTANSQDEIQFCYKHGADGYITKPSGYHELVNRLQATSKYWLETVEQPD